MRLSFHFFFTILVWQLSLDTEWGPVKQSTNKKMRNLLTLLLLFTSLTSFGQMSWKSRNDIADKWIMVERDSAGYLVYDPCNGSTPMITIENGYINIYWQLDAPSKLVINKFTRLKGNKSFYVNASDEGVNLEFNVEIKDAKQKLALWTFGEFKWVMTPFEYKSKFRQVDNPCRTVMKPEKQFLPVEY